MEIKGFKGYRFDSAVVGDAGACISPPYDVIDDELNRSLQAQSRWNVVRIIKPTNEAANDGSDVYQAAARVLNEFVAEKALSQDPADCLYVYQQGFTIEGQYYERTGFIGLGKLESYGGKIKPHEHTLEGPKQDRLRLMRATGTQTGQIFMIYSDPERAVDRVLKAAAAGEPLLEHTDADGVRHRLFALSDPAGIDTIRHTLGDHHVYIADGHHRYETALNYFAETGNAEAEWHMMTFVDTHDEGLVVLPTHRLLSRLDGFDSAVLRGTMGQWFDVARLAWADVVEKKQRYQEMRDALRLEQEQGAHAFGMLFTDDPAFYVATLRETGAMAEVAGDRSEGWRELDVAILQKLILEAMLGIDEAALAEERYISYIKDMGDAAVQAMDEVDAGRAQAMFFMNPTRTDAIERVIETGEKMPQKSTFFFPKIFSGLVLNRL